MPVALRRPAKSSKWEQEGHSLYNKKRGADTTVDDLKLAEEETTTTRDASSASSPAPALVVELPADVPTGPSAVEDLVDRALGPAPGSSSSQSAGEHINSIDLGPSTTPIRLGKGKAEYLDLASLQVDLCFRQQGVDATAEEVKQIAALQVELAGCHVLEPFSQKRFTEQASAFGLKPGFAVDLCEQRPYGPQKGQHWDLNIDDDVKELGKMIEYEDPWLVTGFPPYDPLNTSTRSPRLEERHLHTSIHFYRRQMEHGRYFLHEHPFGASSFKDPQMAKLMKEPGVMVVDGPMCRWDLRVFCPKQGEGLAYKRTKWVTNCPALARILQGECSNK